MSGSGPSWSQVLNIDTNAIQPLTLESIAKGTSVNQALQEGRSYHASMSSKDDHPINKHPSPLCVTVRKWEHDLRRHGVVAGAHAGLRRTSCTCKSAQ